MFKRTKTLWAKLNRQKVLRLINLSLYVSYSKRLRVLLIWPNPNNHSKKSRRVLAKPSSNSGTVHLGPSRRLTPSSGREADAGFRGGFGLGDADRGGDKGLSMGPELSRDFRIEDSAGFVDVDRVLVA